MVIPAARYVTSVYNSAHAEDATWFSAAAGRSVVVRVIRQLGESAPTIPGIGPVNQAEPFLRMQTASGVAAGLTPAKGDTFTVGGVVYAVFGAPRHFDVHQLEWRISVVAPLS